jgi:hypothetical protein
MNYLVDTNILTRIADQAHAMHDSAGCVDALTQAERQADGRAHAADSLVSGGQFQMFNRGALWRKSLATDHEGAGKV